ncbi:MAG: AraC family transcriptional regulator [Prolixibacteraceae bacterium]|nr:AraC family transcriptional regulator [Prolixibacteraceae bacterium]
MGKENNLPIYSLQTFSSPERRSQQFQVEVFNTKRHYEVKYPHRHDFFEVLYLDKGSGFIIIDNNKYEIKPPCVFFLSPGQAHKLELSEDIGGYIFIFTSEFYLINRSNQNRLIEFPFFYTILQNNPPLLLDNDNDKSFIERLFERAVNELSDENNRSIELMRSILDLILTFCSVLYPADYDFKTTGRGPLLVKRFYRLVEENIHKNLSVNQYADLLAVTPNHLTQTLKLLTGKTSNDIIKEKQVLEIKRLLAHTNLNVTEIADQLNFSDQSYFSKFFKRETGLSPNAYRTENQN